MTYPEDPLHATARLAVNWEPIEFELEEAILELSGCPDYRARAITTYLSFFQMWNAFKVLLVEKFDKEFIKSERFRQVETDIQAIRRERNSIIHADWKHQSTEEDITVTAVDMNARKSLTAEEIGYTGSDIGQIADLAMTVHLDLMNFLTTECGIAPFQNKFELPLRGVSD